MIELVVEQGFVSKAPIVAIVHMIKGANLVLLLAMLSLLGLEPHNDNILKRHLPPLQGADVLASLQEYGVVRGLSIPGINFPEISTPPRAPQTTRNAKNTNQTALLQRSLQAQSEFWGRPRQKRFKTSTHPMASFTAKLTRQIHGDKETSHPRSQWAREMGYK